jgi:hypothetical protein
LSTLHQPRVYVLTILTSLADATYRRDVHDPSRRESWSGGSKDDDGKVIIWSPNVGEKQKFKIKKNMISHVHSKKASMLLAA